MTKEDFEKANKPLIDAVERLTKEISILSLIGLADEFYTKDKRFALYEEYEKLAKAEDEARTAYNASSPADGITREQLVNAIGEQAVQEKRAERELLYTKLREEIAKVADFEKKHPIIIKLIRSRSQKGSVH